MPAHRNRRASRPAKKPATRKGITAPSTGVKTLKGTPAQRARPLHECIADIARGASLRRDGNRGHAVKKRVIDDLWGNT